MSCLCGLTFPDKGSVEVEGIKYDATSRKQWREGTGLIRRKAGYVGAKPGLPGTFTGLEFLEWTAGLCSQERSSSEKTISYLIKSLNLGSFANKRIAEYSSGMIQKTSIAASLLAEPEVVFWDEPTSNLDALGRRQVVDLVKEISERGTTFVMATHIPEEFEGLVDWAGVLSAGTLSTAGRVSEYHSESQTYSATTEDPKTLASHLVQLGIGNRVSISGNVVRFSLEPDARQYPSTAEELSTVCECAVKELRREPISVFEIYRRALQGEE